MTGQSQFHDAYKEDTLYWLVCENKIIHTGTYSECDQMAIEFRCLTGKHFSIEYRIMRRFRIVWSREFLQPEKLKGYYIVESKVLDAWEPGYIRNAEGKIVGGNESPMAGLKMFEL